MYCHLLSQSATYRHVSSYINTYHQVSSCSIMYHHVPSPIVTYRHASSCIVAYRHISSCIVAYPIGRIGQIGHAYRIRWSSCFIMCSQYSHCIPHVGRPTMKMEYNNNIMSLSCAHPYVGLHAGNVLSCVIAVSYTHLTLPTKRIV